MDSAGELLCACIVPARESDRGNLRRLLGQDLNWRKFIDLTIRHRLIGVIHQALVSSDVFEQIPPEWRAQIRLLYLSNVAKGKETVEQLGRLTERFRAAAIEVLLVKGPALAMLAYGDLSAREYFDIDLLVRPRDFVRAAELIIDDGFKSLHYHREAVASGFFYNTSEEFHSESLNRLIDLHSRLRDWYFPFGPDDEELWSRTETVKIGALEFPTLGAADYFLFICAHASKHGWMSLAAVADLVNLLSVRPTLDQSELISEAAREGCERMALIGLLLANHLGRTHLAPRVQSKIHADPSLLQIAEHILDRMFADGSRVSELKTWIVAARMLDSWRARANLALGLLCAPTTTDYAALALPQPLYPLYYALRPMRLVVSLLGSVVGRGTRKALHKRHGSKSLRPSASLRVESDPSTSLADSLRSG